MKISLLWYCVLIQSLWLNAVFGQATFEFRNRLIFPQRLIDAPIFDAQGVPLAGTNYSVELYGGRVPTLLMPATDEHSRRIVVPFTALGYFTTSRILIVWSVVAGNYAWLQVRAWDARLGTTYEEVLARGLGGYGESPLFYARGGGGSPNGDDPGLLFGLQSFRLRPITPGVLMRSIQLQGDQALIDWHPGFKRYQLQHTTVLGEPWNDLGVPISATSVTNSISGGTHFFRIVGLLD